MINQNDKNNLLKEIEGKIKEEKKHADANKKLSENWQYISIGGNIATFLSALVAILGDKIISLMTAFLAALSTFAILVIKAGDYRNKQIWHNNYKTKLEILRNDIRKGVELEKIYEQYNLIIEQMNDSYVPPEPTANQK